MNILHMKYAVEVARLGSLSRAAETLLIAQPNISRSIKELEADLGITIFTRSAKGMELTPDGEEFIGYAQNILKEIDSVERLYKSGLQKKQSFSLSSPRAAYISEAFVEFTKALSNDPAEIIYKETNSQKTISNVLNDDYKLGIIRYREAYDRYFKEMLEEKGLSYEMIGEFDAVLLMSLDHPLADKESVDSEELSSYIEIAEPDPYVPTLPLSRVAKEESSDSVTRKIFIFERASQEELLSENNEAFAWSSPSPTSVLKRYGLIEKMFSGQRKYKELLIYKKGYKLSPLDKQFITELCEARRRYIK